MGWEGGEEITALVPLSHKCSPENSLDFRVNYTESILSFGGSSLPYPPRLLTDNEAGTFFCFCFLLFFAGRYRGTSFLKFDVLSDR